MILIYMMVLCTQVKKMYVIATLSVYPHRASLKNMPGHGGIRTYDLWNASPMLCQLSYAVRSVRVYDISELSLVVVHLIGIFTIWLDTRFARYLKRICYTLKHIQYCI